MNQLHSTLLGMTLSGALFSSAHGSGDVPFLDTLQLIEEIRVADQPDDPSVFKEYPPGISEVKEVLGKKVRVIPGEAPGIKYFGYLIGRGKGLKATTNYFLEIEYPEDEPRSMIIRNGGNGTWRGFYTGTSTGDALKPRYVNNHAESLDIPLSGTFRQARMLMFLQDRSSEIAGIRGAEVPDPAMSKRTMKPEDGFWVYISQLPPEQDPLSRGAAVSAIRLYQAPPMDVLSLDLYFPPPGLPRRHLFFREEMADGVIGGTREENGFDDSNDWYVGKAQLMKFLGMNTMGKDLLEFGANQGWDSAKYGGNNWVYQSHDPQRWTRMIATARQYGLSVLPYYEYSGSLGEKGLGKQKRAIPLGEEENYTHIAWTEKARADLTDPDTFEDFRKMLEITIVDQLNHADFVGAWLRPRSSMLPIGFADATLKRFSDETRSGTAVTREQLRHDPVLYDAYISWWKDKRKEFLNKVVGYLNESGLNDAVVIYTADPAEPGSLQPSGKVGLVAENPHVWDTVDLEKPPAPLKVAIRERWSFLAQTTPHGTWGKWEWQHAVPRQDPSNYQDIQGVLPSYSFSRKFTVADSEALKAFSTPSGLAMIRHYSLNEDMLREEKEGGKFDPLGYFVCDMDRTGPYVMLAEAIAVANGNPTHIGYLASNHFNRFEPGYVRNFNAAFLSLPALPALKLEGAASDDDVVVKQIDGSPHGIWLAVVNPTYMSKKQISIRLPRNGRVVDAATGEPLPVHDGHVILDLYPCRLVSLRIQ
ncbi:MAG: hypothetical protein ACFCUX_08460 [Candidatus Methylacidiphilales bacterium]